MSRKYIVSHAGQELGPFSDSELRRMVKSHELLPIDYIYDEDMKDWVMIGERIDLHAEPAPSTSPASISTLGSTNRGDELPPPASVIMRKNPVPQSTQSTKSISLPPPQTSSQSQLPTEPYAQLAKPVASKPSVAPIDEDSPTQTQAKLQSSPSPTTFDPGRIKFKSGVGEISLDPRVAGTIHLGIKECSTSGVSLPPQAELTVQSAQAKKLLWNLRGQVPAGEELKVEIVAKDDFDNVSKSFSASFEVHSNHPSFGKIPVDVVAGFGQFKLQLTLAGQFQFELKALAPNSLQLPSVTAVSVRPGRPVKLIMDAPKEVVAGQSVSVLVKAVDAFGNLVTDYEGDAAIDIKAS